jgi:hypothetical protein
MLKMEKAFAEKNRQLNAKLFITLGGFEKTIGPPMYQNFVGQLRDRKYKGFEMKDLVIDKAGHLTAAPYAIIRGLQFIFSKPDLTLDTALLKQYAGRYEGTEIIYSHHALYLSFGTKKIKMNAETDKKFYIEGANGEIEFKRDQKAKIKGFQFDGADAKIFIKKIE